MPSRAQTPYYFTWKQVTKSSRRLEHAGKGVKPVVQPKVINRQTIGDELIKAQAKLEKLMKEANNQ